MMGFGGFGGCCGYGSYGAYGWIGLILNILFFVAVFGGMIWLVVWGVRRATGNGGSTNNTAISQSPRDLLQARYVRGEIDRDQYLSMLNDLETS
jgi:uncharacterized membrane protein